jgi:hypothetical protein
VTDHATHLAAAQSDRPQHAELAGALKDGQHQGVDNPEEADDDRELEQDIEQVEQHRQRLLLVVLEL